MFYLELCTELGKLFYDIAGIDGSESPGEKEVLQKCISKTWKPMEGYTDRYGTDKAYLINFSFEFEESACSGKLFQIISKVLPSEQISLQHRNHYSILKTSQSIADAYRGKNKKEKAELDSLFNLFEKENQCLHYYY